MTAMTTIQNDARLDFVASIVVAPLAS